MKNKAAMLAQKQLDAYNKQNIENFLAVYHEDVSIYEFPSKLLYTGLDKMSERYSQLFKENPNQHAELLSRMVNNNIVTDHEHVTGRENGIDVFAIAIYEVEEDKITKVWFIK
ncbi:nuclear transport factor 2 family protein [Alkalihalobacterium alkalinitrilicum]|uniref:nuclear transport factor 2 family protein n=1 Tax=Alkalihalobacterium alkalinitrilicum TaxID=427920 RepID=UPI0009959142|nr:nuclear transport factor 2 family protein [Alkalihalobacterium alkalinitrilicum]